ncbi:MAG: 30S ribosomal protein S5 [bacterium]
MTETAKRHTFSGGKAEQEYENEVLDIARVVRVVKGGRRFSFRASVVAGNRAGKVGFGLGRSRDVQTAIQKAYNQAAKNMINIKVKDGTIAHKVSAKFKGAQVLLQPARPGTGIIAGSPIRLVADLIGVRDLVAKRFGSANKISNVRAAVTAMKKLH